MKKAKKYSKTKKFNSKNYTIIENIAYTPAGARRRKKALLKTGKYKSIRTAVVKDGCVLYGIKK